MFDQAGARRSRERAQLQQETRDQVKQNETSKHQNILSNL